MPCNKKSWFVNTRLICLQYNLQDPLLLMQEPPIKVLWKRQCKSAVMSYWEEKLRQQASQLPSLLYFKPQFMSLRDPHFIWEMAESGYEVKKAVIACTMLSGRYNTDYHSRHWSKNNPLGFCQLCRARSHSQDVDQVATIPLGSLEHLLLECPELHQTRDGCRNLWISHANDKPTLQCIIPTDLDEILVWNPTMEMLLDPTACPDIIRASQLHGCGIYAAILYLS